MNKKDVTKKSIPTRDINQGREIVSVAVEEELHEVGYKALTLPKEIFTEENDNRQGGKTKKCNAEILKNAKPKEIVKVVNTESYQKSSNSNKHRVRDILNREDKHYKQSEATQKI